MELPPLPPLPPTGAFLPFPGEPDKAAEVRLRGALRGFRAAATTLSSQSFLEEFEKKMREPGGIWSPEAIAQRYESVRPIIEKSMSEIKERLLAIEQTFIEKGWRLPKWERPSWLVE